MSLTSINDQILIKTLRIRHMLNEGEQVSSEPPESNFIDIFNYCVFALVGSDE